VTPSSDVAGHPHFGGPCSLHVQGGTLPQHNTESEPRRARLEYLPPLNFKSRSGLQNLCLGGSVHSAIYFMHWVRGAVFQLFTVDTNM